MAISQAIILEAADQNDANQFWVERGAGANTFSVGLVPSTGPANATPPTHFIASAQFERFFPGSIFALQSEFPATVVVETNGSNALHTARINAKLAEMSLQKQSFGI